MQIRIIPFPHKSAERTELIQNIYCWKFNFYHLTYFYNFEAFKFHWLNHLKIWRRKNFCILKVTEDFYTDPHPHPYSLVREVRIRGSGSVPKCHRSGTLLSEPEPKLRITAPAPFYFTQTRIKLYLPATHNIGRYDTTILKSSIPSDEIDVSNNQFHNSILKESILRNQSLGSFKSLKIRAPRKETLSKF